MSQPRITCSVVITPDRVEGLYVTSMASFLHEQPERFDYDVTADAGEDWTTGGTMYWCATALDAIFLEAYERASGHRVLSLWDHAADTWGDEPYVVLSERERLW